MVWRRLSRDHRRRFKEMRQAWREQSAAISPPAWESADPAHPLQQWVLTEYQEILRLLMRSFVSQHLVEVGLDAEDQAIDKMKHLSWMAEALAERGAAPALAPPSSPVRVSVPLLREWAEAEMPGLLPLLNRMAAHESYHRVLESQSGWTLGSGLDAGWV